MSTKKKLSDKDIPGRLAAGGLKVLGQLPIGTSGALGRQTGRIAWHLAKGSTNVTKRNLELCFPDKSAEDIEKLAKESIIETMMTAFEMASAWVQPVDELLKKISHVDNEHIYLDALKTGRGIVLLVPHFGNWELCNYFMAKQNSSLLAMYKAGKSPALNRLILHSRQQITEMVPADKKGVLAMFNAVKQGRVTGLLPDQEPSIKSGVWAPFFGIPALTPTLVSKVLQKTNAIAMGYGCQRNPDGKSYHIFYEKVDDAIYSDDIETSATAMNHCIERIILRDPAQYQWEYKRFKRRPDGGPNPY